MASFVIKSYSVQITNCKSPYAYIMLFDASTGSAATFRARLDFSQLDETNSYQLTQTGNFIQVPMNFKAFASTVDLLRNEQPLTFNWYTSTKVCIIATGDEPVGEGEV